MFGIFILLAYSKADGFLILNPYHPRLLDYFFIGYTYFGDGLFIVTLALILFFCKKRFLSLMIVSSYAFSGVIVLILKYFIVEARPAFYLKNINYTYFIDGVTLHNFHSFPSGHTTSAFALAAILGFAAKNKNYAIIFLLMAALVGYSRIYLGQHFMDDVVAGSCIGLVSAIICELFFAKYFMSLSERKR